MITFSMDQKQAIERGALKRKRLIRMWREAGIFVFNVYQGEEDF